MYNLSHASQPDTIKTVAGIVLGLYMLWENRRRDRLQASQGPPFDEHEGQRLSLLDKTEFVRPFIVIYRSCLALTIILG